VEKVRRHVKRDGGTSSEKKTRLCGGGKRERRERRQNTKAKNILNRRKTKVGNSSAQGKANNFGKAKKPVREFLIT